MINRFAHASNYKLIFTARDSIGRAVMNKKGSIHDSSAKDSGVYHIPCSTPGCNKPYFGRTMTTLEKRMSQHESNIADKSDDSALVNHIRSHPGHGFNTKDAKLIWKSHNKYECQFVEAACISRFPSCNISRGEIRVTPVMSAFTTYIAGIHKQLGQNTSSNGHGSTAISPLPPAPSAVSTLPPVIAHIRLSPSLASSSSSDDLASSISQPPASGNNAPLPTQNSSHIDLPQVSNVTLPLVTTSHSLQSPPSSNGPTSVISEQVTNSSSQPITSSHHRSLRRIACHNQTISISPRRLRSHTPSSQ